MRKTPEQLFEKLGVGPQILEKARQRQAEKGGSLRKNLIALGEVTEKAFSTHVSEVLRVSYINLEHQSISDNVLKLLSRAKAEKYCALPIELDERHRRLSVSMADPSDMSAIDELKFVVGFTVIPHFTPEDELLERIHLEYSRLEDQDAVAAAWSTQLNPAGGQEQIIELAGLAGAENPLLRFIGEMFSVALDRGASRIHITPSGLTLGIPGKERQHIPFPRKIMFSLLPRLKRTFGIEASEQMHRMHAGYNTLKLQNKKDIDLSYFIFSTGHGEEMLIKLKDRTTLPTWEEFNIEPKALCALERALHQTSGAVVVSGPTRSGLTTSLYAALLSLSAPELHVLTIEHPVECALQGVVQAQVTGNGASYRQYIESARELSPDLFMVDNLFDFSSVQEVLSFAGGARVLTSVSAVDTASAALKLRFLSSSRLVADRINCITSQRLVKKICEHCQEKVPLAKAYREKLGLSSDDVCYAGKGCDRCAQTGYLGVVPLVEIMPFTSEIRHAILEARLVKELRQCLAKEGYPSLRDDGMRKVKQGITTIQEVLKATML